jgi:hypothetical protein
MKYVLMLLAGSRLATIDLNAVKKFNEIRNLDTSEVSD